MCFSAEVSFSAAVIIGGIGYSTFKNMQNRSLRFLALIPFLFALQQLGEGLLWTSITYQTPSWTSFFGKYLFLSIAFIIWPIWNPLAFAMAEPQRRPRMILWGLVCAGIIIAGISAYAGLAEDAKVTFYRNMIAYNVTIPPIYLPYAVVTILPYFVSTLPKMAWIGTTMFISCLIAAYFYFQTFTSVWCFSAAIVSIMYYFVLKSQPEESSSQFLQNK